MTSRRAGLERRKERVVGALMLQVPLFLCLALILAAALPISSSAPSENRVSSIADLATSMKPGSWAQLNTNNFQSGAVLAPPGAGSILEYTDRQVWNPVAKTVMIVGGSHTPSTGQCADTMAVQYAEATGTWSSLPNPCPNFDQSSFNGIANLGHAYDHNTIDTNTGNLYHRQYYSGNVAVFQQATQTWTKFTNAYCTGSSCEVAGALTYFADRNSLVMLDGDDGVWEYALSQGTTGSWKQRASSANRAGMSPVLSGVSSYHNEAEYSAQCHCVILGGGNGSTTLYKYDASGKFTQIATAPAPVKIPDCSASNGSILTVDPVGGDLLLWDFATAGSQFYEYNPGTNTWKTVSIASPIFPGPDGGTCQTVAIPISTYGVVMFVQKSSASGGGAGIWLYKHASGAPAISSSATNSSTTVAQTEPDSAPSSKVGDSREKALRSEQQPPRSYEERCHASGVIKCVGFDSQEEIIGKWGDNHGILSGATTPSLDPTVKASGNSSLKFTIPPNSGADTSGSYFTNFSSDLTAQFGENSEFYVQWRQRFSPEFLSTYYEGGEGWKQAIIGSGDQPGRITSSCTDIEVVVENSYQRGFAQMYNSCTGSSSHVPYDPFQQRLGANDFKLQNARSGPSCLYSQGKTKPPSFFPPKGNCFGYFANEWMTFQVHIKTGPRVHDEFANSYAELWIAREGRPSELVIQWGPYNLSAGSASESPRFGKVWLLPYDTNKSPSQATPTAFTWYDELIISRLRIPDPT
jgi:hypothetical protein